MDIIYSVSQGFYFLYRATRELEIAQEKLNNSEEAYRVAKLKNESGRIPEGDVLIAEVEVGQNRAALLEKEGNLEREKDDFKFLIIGMYVANLIPLGYIFSTQPWHIFTMEFIRGLAMACVIPTWSGIFTRHIDKGREAFSWSIESTGIGFAAGLAGAFGGILASIVGFKIVFALVSAFGLLSSSTLLLIRRQIFLKNHFAPRLPPAEKPF